jgi:hypothetical protein
MVETTCILAKLWGLYIYISLESPDLPTSVGRHCQPLLAGTPTTVGRRRQPPLAGTAISNTWRYSSHDSLAVTWQYPFGPDFFSRFRCTIWIPAAPSCRSIELQASCVPPCQKVTWGITHPDAWGVKAGVKKRDIAPNYSLASEVTGRRLPLYIKSEPNPLFRYNGLNSKDIRWLLLVGG